MVAPYTDADEVISKHVFVDGVDPVTTWPVEDVVKLIEHLDAELQRREYAKNV